MENFLYLIYFLRVNVLLYYVKDTQINIELNVRTLDDRFYTMQMIFCLWLKSFTL